MASLVQRKPEQLQLFTQLPPPEDQSVGIPWAVSMNWRFPHQVLEPWQLSLEREIRSIYLANTLVHVVY